MLDDSVAVASTNESQTRDRERKPITKTPIIRPGALAGEKTSRAAASVALVYFLARQSRP